VENYIGQKTDIENDGETSRNGNENRRSMVDMGMFDRLKGLKAGYDARASKTLGDREARKEQDAALRSAEAHMIKDYNLKRTGTPGRYLVGNDKVIDVNIRSFDSINAARSALDKHYAAPTVKKLSKSELSEISQGSLLGRLSDMGQNFNANFGNVGGGAGGGIGNYDFMGGGFGGGIGDYDFMGGGTSKPRKRRKSSSKRKKR
jgi:hypothetical protein